jgi:hypothetical protein
VETGLIDEETAPELPSAVLNSVEEETIDPVGFESIVKDEGLELVAVGRDEVTGQTVV